MSDTSLTREELDALLELLDKEWLPLPVQQAYDKLAAERARRAGAEARLADLERRLREAAESTPAGRASGEEGEAGEA